MTNLKSSLKSGSFTGSRKEGNPYLGDVDKGIAYDADESDVNVIVNEGNNTQLVTSYRSQARRLVRYLNTKKGDTILDLGSGTGISALELLLQHPGINVIGVEQSPGTLYVARYKFNLEDGYDLLERVKDKKLLSYWKNFRKDSEKFVDQVEFRLGDFQKIDSIHKDSIDNAIGNQFMHWTDLSKTYRQLYRFLKPKRSFFWNTASHFFHDPEFPSSVYGCRYNDFLKYVLEEVSKSFSVGDYKQLCRPEHTLESIQKISLENGFETKHLGTFLEHVDMQFFIKDHIPHLVKELVRPEINSEELRIITQEAIAKIINKPGALEDTMHKYEIGPIFKSIKI